jgi:hypothetical protein
MTAALQRGLPATVAAGLLLLGLIALSAACGGSGDEAEMAAAPETPDAATAAPQTGDEEKAGAASATPLPRRTVEIYFPSRDDNGLIGEYREIFDTLTPGDRAKQIIADLISGPENDGALRALPQATRLRQVFVMADGVAYLDFSSELSEQIGGGSMEEILAVYAIVDSVVINVSEIDRVGLLINGRPVATLNGHLDLRRPLAPDYSLILGSMIVGRPVEGPVRLASATPDPAPSAGAAR